jgi:hypothetical protein
MASNYNEDPVRAHEELKRWVQSRETDPLRDDSYYDFCRDPLPSKRRWYHRLARYFGPIYLRYLRDLGKWYLHCAWIKFWNVPPLKHPVYSRKIGGFNVECLEVSMRNGLDPEIRSIDRRAAADPSPVKSTHASSWRDRDDNRLPTGQAVYPEVRFTTPDKEETEYINPRPGNIHESQ